MSKGQERHLARILRESQKLIDEKYRKGQAEHGGSLDEMPAEKLLDEAILEAVDQMVYLLTLREKLSP
jgi:hypothetical protein